jgi:hypothetical protein
MDNEITVFCWLNYIFWVPAYTLFLVMQKIYTAGKEKASQQ